jgi:hypothetical protein
MRRTFEVGSGVDGFQSEAPLGLSPSGRGWQREARPDEGGLSKAGARFAQTHPYPSPVRGRNRASMSIQRALNGFELPAVHQGALTQRSIGKMHSWPSGNLLPSTAV